MKSLVNNLTHGNLPWVVMLSLLIACTDSGQRNQCIGTFYGFGKPSSTNIGGSQIDVGPSLYTIDFNPNLKDGNWVKLTIQELEISKDQGGSWSAPLTGTTITSEYYTDHYAEPVIVWGKYETSESTDSISVTGQINQGEYLQPLKFNIILPKDKLDFINGLYMPSDSFDVCFEVSIEPNKVVRYCSRKTYFIDQMISEYETTFKSKMSQTRRNELYEMNDVD